MDIDDDRARDLIGQKLLETIAEEDKQNPMSDEEIVEEMGRRGLEVARRTVTRRRHSLRVPSRRQRRPS